MDVVKMSTTKNGKASEALVMIGKLYDIERQIKEEELPPDKIREVRQKKSKPLLDEFKKWLEMYVDRVPPKNPLAEAMRYALNQWVPLTEYIKDGILDIDNNACERAIRPFVIGRKNWLFMGSVSGARSSSTLYSLIETCKANRINPSDYLAHVITVISTTPKDKMETLLPWNCNLTPTTIDLPTPEK
jgi:hypothetical protein